MNEAAKTSRLDVMALMACLLIALALRTAVILNQPEQLAVDRDAYLGIATSVAEGRGYSSPDSTTPTAFRPPLYPLTLALGFLWFSNAFVVANINLLTGLGTVALTASLGKHLHLGRLRFVAALLVAVDPLLLQYSPQAMTECFCTFLTVLWLRSTTMFESSDTGDVVKAKLQQSQEASASGGSTARQVPIPTDHSAASDDSRHQSEPHPIVAMVIGVAFGLLVLSRPTFWVIAGVYGLKWLVELRFQSANDAMSRPDRFATGIWSAIGTMITVAPWVIRNWIVIGVPILTTTHGGYTLLLGNNPVFYDQVVRQPWGTVWPEASQQEWGHDLEAQLKDKLGPQASEVDRDAWQSHLAKTYMTTEPSNTVAASLHRVRSLWNTTPQVEAGGNVSRLAIAFVGWFYALELTAGFLGMLFILRRSDRARWLPLYILIVCVQLVHLFYWTNTRMRAPLTPAIALFAVAAIAKRNVMLEQTSTNGES